MNPERRVDDLDRHGRQSSYVSRGCRCEPCTAANTRAVATRRHARRAELVTRDDRPYAPNAPSHGTSSTYQNWGCRCAPCAAAHALRRRAYPSRSSQVKVGGRSERSRR